MSVARRCLSLIVTACVLMPGAMPGAARGQQAGAARGRPPSELLLAIVVRGADCGGLPASIAVPGRPAEPANENGVYYLRGAAGQEYTLTVTHRGYDSEERTLRLEERQSGEYIDLRRSTDRARCDDLLGRVDGIKELVRGGRDERPHSAPTSRVQRRPGAVPSRIDMAPDSSLFLDDSLRVDRQFHARVTIDRQAGRRQSGTLVFFAEPKDAGLDTVIQRDRTDQPGSFALKRDGDQVAIAIRSGALGVAEWNPGGSLTVHAGGQTVEIRGTSALFLAADSGDAIMFLDEGEIGFPDHPDVEVPEKGVFWLQNDSVPRPLPGANAALLGALSAELTFAVKDLWAASLFEKPWIYLGAAVVGVVTWCIIDPDCPTPDPEADVTFVVPNPSRF